MTCREKQKERGKEENEENTKGHIKKHVQKENRRSKRRERGENTGHSGLKESVGSGQRRGRGGGAVEGDAATKITLFVRSPSRPKNSRPRIARGIRQPPKLNTGTFFHTLFSHPHRGVAVTRERGKKGEEKGGLSVFTSLFFLIHLLEGRLE